MDKQTIDWLINAINSAPDELCLDGIRVSCEWFYGIDKDFESFEYLLGIINNKYKTIQHGQLD